LSTAGGHEVVLDDAAQRIDVRHSNGSVITIDAGGNVIISANARVDVTAPSVQVHTASITFDGVVQCDTLIASGGVVSPSYSPGARNVM
jgi:phage baseplate assembly protein gpV